MNINKILQNTIKKYKDPEAITSVCEGLPGYTGKVVAVGNKFSLYFIADEDFLLDVEKILEGREPFKLDWLLKEEEEAEPAWQTAELRQLEKGKAIKIRNDKAEAWVNMKLLEPFSKNCGYKITKYNKPVWVCEGDRLVGMVMPVRVKEEEHE